MNARSALTTCYAAQIVPIVGKAPSMKLKTHWFCATPLAPANDPCCVISPTLNPFITKLLPSSLMVRPGMVWIEMMIDYPHHLSDMIHRRRGQPRDTKFFANIKQFASLLQVLAIFIAEGIAYKLRFLPACQGCFWANIRQLLAPG